MNPIPIVVLTPVKNEDWILQTFLQVTSCFADLIIIADQFSTDSSKEIALSFKKVCLIKNENPEYDENYRQRLLIDKARELLKGPKLLLCLDADEILAGSSFNLPEWEKILSLSPGTIVKFPKHDVLIPEDKAIYHSTGFPLGYIDDGAEHTGKKIHSPRIPMPLNAAVYNASEIIFMHYALARPIEYWARQRLYSMIENIKGIHTLSSRLNAYSRELADFTKKNQLKKLPKDWFELWEKKGIPVRAIRSSHNNHYNKQIMQLMMEHGGRRFWLDDIWYEDYSQIASAYSEENFDPMYFESIKPTTLYRFLCRMHLWKVKSLIILKTKARQLLKTKA